jgi:PST family polysaccharide transporter
MKARRRGIDSGCQAMSDYLSAPSTDLRKRAGRAGRASVVGQVVGTILGFVSIAVLARYVPPHDYGLFAMASVVTSIGMIFSDAGLGTALVMHDRVTQQQASNLFWVNLGLGSALTALACGLAPAIAWFYGHPELVGIALASSFVFLTTSAGIQHGALLRRRLEFGRLTLAGQLAVAIGVLVAIAFAQSGAGYWALVAQVLTMTAARTALYWALCPWRPSRPRLGGGTRKFVSFGGIATASELMIQFNRSIESVLVGRVLGADALGLFNRTSTLFMQVPLQVSGPFYAVAMPAMSRVQDEPIRFAEAYRHGVLLVGAIALPILSFIFAAAEPVIAVLLGGEWSECSPLLRLFVGDVLATTIGPATVGWLFLYRRRVGAQLAWTSGCFVAKAVILALVVHHGIEACALSLSAISAFALFVGVIVASRGTPVSPRDAWIPLAVPVTASALAGTCVWFALATFPFSSGVEQLLLAMPVFALTYALPWLALRHGRRQARLIWSLAAHRR